MKNTPYIMKKYKVSEIFFSPQGEGKYTGQLSMWVRFFACNLQCNGFGQINPLDPSTYELPYKDIDVSKYKSITELPVITKGCDSSYSWAAKFKSLIPEYTAEEIVAKLIDVTPNNNFFNYANREPYHLVFTGGEPLLPQSQIAILDISWAAAKQGFFFPNVTVETNGTQVLTDELRHAVYQRAAINGWLFSVSPKLESVSGEDPDKAIQPDIVYEYYRASNGNGQLKFVMNNSKEAWEELEHVVNEFREAGVWFPVWIMPVGSTRSQQLEPDTTAIVRRAISKGYNISARLQSYLFDNAIGT